MNVLKYNRFNFIVENLQEEIIKESSEFGDMQMGLGPGYASDPSVSLYSDGSTQFIDNYERMSKIVGDLNKIMKDLYSQGALSISNHKFDYFLEDVDEYQQLKILRTVINNKMTIDVFISFIFMDEEFFGVFREYNGINKTQLSTDLFTDPRFSYIDKEYKLKLSNYMYKILFNWFIPNIGDYRIISDELKVKDPMGNNIMLKKGNVLTVKGYNTDANNDPFLMVRLNTEIYKITSNDFYYFKYRCVEN